MTKILNLINQKASPSDAWADPQPLTTKIEGKPYPVDSLPDTVRKAVIETQAVIKAPVPLVACSAIGAISAAVQAHIDIRRAERLEGPTSLFFLILGDSGERKTTVDSRFTAAIKKHDAEQAEAAEPLIKQYEKDSFVYAAAKDRIGAQLKSTSKTAQTDRPKLLKELDELKLTEPEPPRVPRLLIGDDTPESLCWKLAKGWPSKAIISSEGGLVLGAHGMGKDSIMRSLGLYNVLWDGGSHDVGRRTSESFTVEGARLSIGLQVQEATLREFFSQSGKLARGTGFMARFLIAWPESTQGTRLYTEPPQGSPALSLFNDRMTAILNDRVPLEDGRKLAPKVMRLSPEAKAEWIRFHDAVEVELSDGKDLRDIRDVASKAADNAARLATLFHAFEHGVDDPVGLESFVSAKKIITWHLNESRRFFGELALPDELADAERLDTYLIVYCKREKTHSVSRSIAFQYGPLRKKDRLDNAIHELNKLDRVDVVKEGKATFLQINPKLLEINRE